MDEGKDECGMDEWEGWWIDEWEGCGQMNGNVLIKILFSGFENLQCSTI